MITHETIDGRPAVVAYIDDDLNPVSPDDATMIKIIFEDGEIRFGVKSAQDRLKSQFASEKRRAQALLKGGTYNEADHPRGEGGRWVDAGGGEGEGGDDRKPAVPGFKAGVKARGDEVDKIRDQWVEESPVKTVEDIQRAAPLAQETLNDAATKIAEQLGVKAKLTTAKTQKIDEKTGEVVESPKGVARILEKVAARELETGRKIPLARVTDTARGTIVLNHPDDAEKVIGLFGKTHEVAAENWRTIPDSWYTDRTVLLRDRETGLIAEMQLAHPALLDAKDNKGGHAMYERARSLPDADPVRLRLNAEMQALYGPILDGLSPEWKEIDGRRRRL